jgi:hypothetical protein
MNKKREVKVTAQGSLGILALGSEGIRLWRKAVAEEARKDKPVLKKTNEKEA